MTQPTERRSEIRPDDLGWHLDKKVPLSLIFAVIVQAAMFVGAWMDLKKDVEILKARVQTHEIRDDRQDMDMKESLALLRESLEVLNAKMDRLIERGQK